MRIVLLQIRTVVLGALLSLFGLVFLTGAPVHASATVELTVNGGSTATVVNGSTVTLAWLIDGTVSSCVINNGVGPIDTSSLPASGSMEVTPPDSASTDYTLTCTGGSSSAIVTINPEVTISVDNTTQERDLISGEARVLVDWTSRYATECTRVWFEEAINPGVVIWSTAYGDEYQTSGNVEFDDDTSQPPITRDTTFYIECSNTVTGASTVDSIFVTVIDPDPLPPPTANIMSAEPGGVTTVTRNALTAKADVELSWNSNAETDQCAFQAYYLDGTPYTDAPQGFDRYGNPTAQWAGTFYVDIYESTRFEVTCTNFAYSLSGIDYPEESATADVIITVEPGLPLDRTGQPQVTVSITPYDNYVEEIPGVGYGQVTVEIDAEHAEQCAFTASGDADGWWGLTWGDVDVTDAVTVVNLNVGTTTLYADCERPFDTSYYAPGSPEYEAGRASAQVDIVILPTTATASLPTAYIYGNANYQNAVDIWENSTVETGFCRNIGSNPGNPYGVDAALRSPTCSGGNPQNVTSNGTVTFPFVSPSEQSDTYDIIVKYCDESDGFNDFSISTENGFNASWRSDAVGQQHDWCHDDNEVTRVIGTDITLEDGELVTVECNNTADSEKDEQCIFMGLAVGQQNGGSLNYSVSSSTGFAEVPVFWANENAVDCYNPTATTLDSSTYNFSTTYQPNDYFLTVDLSETTNLSIDCENSEGAEDTSSIDIIIDTGEVTSTTTVEVSECYDPSIPGVRNAEDWEWANPDNSNFCEAAVDLNALAPSISFADAIADNVAGLYDSLEALVAIENLGPGPLAAGNEIEYMTIVEFPQAIRDQFGVGAFFLSPSTPGYADGLAQPPDADNPTATPVLTRTYDGVPFGTHELCVYINLDGYSGSPNLIFDEWNSDTDNNVVCTEVVLPVPPPPMSISADRSIVRKGGVVDITWSAHTSYPLECRVQGPGGITAIPQATFNANDNDPNPVSYVATTNALESTSNYRIACTEPITGTEFIEEISVEVIPVQQEV